MSTVDLVEDAIRGRLSRGELEPGARLRQDELAQELGVSKIPVREALQRLAARGLLRFEANRGAVVREVTIAEAEEIYALRRAIEPQLLVRALPNMSVVDLAAAELALQSGDLSVTESNWAFHRALYRASAWTRGLEIAEILHVAIAPYVKLVTDELGGAAESDSEHGRLLAACRSGAADDAQTQLCLHLDHAEQTLISFLREAVG